MNKIKNQEYSAPNIKVVSFFIEKGFQQSFTGKGTEGFTSQSSDTDDDNNTSDHNYGNLFSYSY